MSELNEVAPSRRAVLGGVAAVGAGAVLAACSGGAETPSGTDMPTAPPATTTSSGGAAVAKVSDVPVGGGFVSDSAKAVITQPTAGEFKAFDSTCTHKGCPVKTIQGDVVICPCHGSQFSLADGSVKQGPATRPLAPKKVAEKNGELFVS